MLRSSKLINIVLLFNHGIKVSIVSFLAPNVAYPNQPNHNPAKLQDLPSITDDGTDRRHRCGGFALADLVLIWMQLQWLNKYYIEHLHPIIFHSFWCENIYISVSSKSSYFIFTGVCFLMWFVVHTKHGWQKQTKFWVLNKKEMKTWL